MTAWWKLQVVLNVQKSAALDAALGQGPKLTAAPQAGIQVQSLGAAWRWAERA